MHFYSKKIQWYPLFPCFVCGYQVFLRSPTSTFISLAISHYPCTAPLRSLFHGEKHGEKQGFPSSEDWILCHKEEVCVWIDQCEMSRQTTDCGANTQLLFCPRCMLLLHDSLHVLLTQCALWRQGSFLSLAVHSLHSRRWDMRYWLWLMSSR